MTNINRKLSNKEKRILKAFKDEVEQAYMDRNWRAMLINDVKKDYRQMFPNLKPHFA